MNILVVSAVDPRRAAHNRIHEMIRFLSRRHNLDIVSSYAWWLETDGKPQYATAYYTGELESSLSRVTLRDISSRRRSPLIQELLPVLVGSRTIKQLGRSYDIVLNYNTVLSGLAFALHLKTVPMVYDLADDIASMAADSPTVPRILRPIVRPISKASIRATVMRSRAVVITTPHLASEYLVPKNRVKVIPNGVDTDAFIPYDKDRSKNHFGVGGHLVIGYVGVLREWVDYRMVIDAMVVLKARGIKPQFVVVGGEGDLVGLRLYARESGVEAQVVTTGVIPYSDVPLAISAMDVGLIPFSLNPVTNTALPMKLFEYMSCEIPVISQRLPPVMDAVGDAVLYASSVAELADSISWLLTDESLARGLGSAGRRTVETSWTWEKVGRELDLLLRQVGG